MSYGEIYKSTWWGETVSGGFGEAYRSLIGDERFIISVKTDNAGTSTSTQFTLPWTGTYNVDWGDGTIEEGVSGSQTHTYSTAGTYDIAITAATGSIAFNNGGDKTKLVDIKNWGDGAWTSMNGAFRGCSNTIVSAEDALVLPADCGNMLRSCSSLTTLDVSNWDTSSVTIMSGMFNTCGNLTTLDVSSWNTSSVTNIGFMFENCSSLTTLDVSGWDTSSVTTMGYMFSGCSSLTTLDVSGWVTSSVTNMNRSFQNSSNLKADLSGLDIALVTDFTNFALNTNINEASTTTNYDNTLISWAAQTPTSGLNVHFGTAQYSWRAIEARNTLVNTYNWTITDGGLLEEPEFVITVETTTASESFTIPTTGTGYSYNVDWGDGSTSTAQTGNAAHTYATAGQYDIQITGTFPRIYFNNTGDKDKLVDIKNWGDVAWTNMSGAFWGCTNTIVSAEDALVLPADCSTMFFGCSSLTTLEVSNWNTSSVTNMTNMLRSCTSLTSLDVSNWDTSSVTGMSYMFRLCSNLKADLSGLDIASVIDLNNFASGTNINEEDGLGNQITTNYDNTLISWAAQTPVSGLNVHFGDAQYSLGGAAETARTTLVTTYLWTITDGGGA